MRSGGIGLRSAVCAVGRSVGQIRVNEPVLFFGRGVVLGVAAPRVILVVVVIRPFGLGCR